MDAEHFWKMVDRSGECWIWTGAKVGNGYGKVYFGGKTCRAHRISWELTHGPIAPNLVVLHLCDNPPCVRPDHLTLGTIQENNDDKKWKGRQAKGDATGSRLYPGNLPHGDAHYSHIKPELVLRGERHGMAKLTEDQVRQIRVLHKNGIGRKELCAMFGVSTHVIWQVQSGRSWTHVR